MKKFGAIPTDFKSRIVFSTLGAILVASLTFGSSVLFKSFQMSQQALISRIKIESDIISQNLVTPIIFDDAKTAEEILESFISDKAIINARLETPNNKSFSFYTNKNNKTHHTARRFINHQEIKFYGKTVGTLILEVSKKEIYQQNVEVLIFLGAILFLITLISTFTCLPIIKSLLLPLLKLHAISEKIAKTRDYTLRAQVRTSDEVGRLSSMFNSMLSQIENRDLMLEKQVAQRTLELEKLAEEFRFRAFHDSLTGLPNRALLNERFEHSLEHSKRSQTKFACLLLDLDDFKTINDTKGHEFGDELLVDVSVRLKNTVRSEDLVCRLGGDEFVIILNDIMRKEDINVIANNILYQLSLEFSIKGETIKTGVSVGGALFPDHGLDISTIKRHADVAMYRAKDSGKNQYCLFSQGMQDDVKFRLMIQNGLAAALAENQFEMYFQPKINAFENSVVGCEALIRWNHPKEGFLTPDKFIPYAEEIGKVAEIDYFVIKTCCSKIAQWKDFAEDNFSIAINLSGRHFHNFQVVDVLRGAINNNKIDPKSLEVEITEAVLIADPEKAKKIVHAIKDLGCGISLDDFGTGYSSLDYLRTLPIDTVKLDRSFVVSIDKNPQDRRLTKGIVSLASGLNLQMVAEGVETRQQLDTLLELGCSTMQGYYFLPPRKSSEFLDWVAKYKKEHA